MGGRGEVLVSRVSSRSRERGGNSGIDWRKKNFCERGGNIGQMWYWQFSGKGEVMRENIARQYFVKGERIEEIMMLITFWKGKVTEKKTLKREMIMEKNMKLNTL